jgi:hypothetical protein
MTILERINYSQRDFEVSDYKMQAASVVAAAVIATAIVFAFVALHYHNETPDFWTDLDAPFREELGQLDPTAAYWNSCADLRWVYSGVSAGTLAIGLTAIAYAVNQKIEKEKARVFLACKAQPLTSF